MSWLLARAREATTWLGLSLIAAAGWAVYVYKAAVWHLVLALVPIVTGAVMALLSNERLLSLIDLVAPRILEALHNQRADPPAALQEDMHMASLTTTFATGLLDSLEGAAASLPAPYGAAVSDVIAEVKSPSFANTVKTITDLVAVFDALNTELEVLRAQVAAQPTAQPAAAEPTA